MKYDIQHSDCQVWMSKQSDEFLDCIITSPPYNLNIKYNVYSDDLSHKEYLDWLDNIFLEIKRVLKSSGHFFLNIGYTNKDPWVAMDVAQIARKHFVLQNQIVWVKHILIDKQSHGIYKPISSNRFIAPTSEFIYHFTKTGDIPINREAIGHRNQTHPKYPELYQESRYIAENRRRICRKMGFKDWLSFQKEASEELKIRFDAELKKKFEESPWDENKKKCIGNVWYIPYTPVSKLAKEIGSEILGNNSIAKAGHPATYPEQLPDMCLKLSGIGTDSIVYDPFGGTGTTVIAALKNGMTGIMTDIDQSYINFAKNRIDNFIKNYQKDQLSLF